MKIKKIISLILLAGAYLPIFAAENVEMADLMRSNGKIYVVVAVIAIIFTGLFIYLIQIDRKIHKLEKQIQSK